MEQFNGHTGYLKVSLTVRRRGLPTIFRGMEQMEVTLAGHRRRRMTIKLGKLAMIVVEESFGGHKGKIVSASVFRS